MEVLKVSAKPILMLLQALAGEFGKEQGSAEYKRLVRVL